MILIVMMVVLMLRKSSDAGEQKEEKVEQFLKTFDGDNVNAYDKCGVPFNYN